jgi:hypothetical protein
MKPTNTRTTTRIASTLLQSGVVIRPTVLSARAQSAVDEKETLAAVDKVAPTAGIRNPSTIDESPEK